MRNFLEDLGLILFTLLEILAMLIVLVLTVIIMIPFAALALLFPKDVMRSAFPPGRYGR